MDNSRELVHSGFLVTDLEDPDLGLGHTAEVARFDVRLVLTVAVASCGTTTHG